MTPTGTLRVQRLDHGAAESFTISDDDLCIYEPGDAWLRTKTVGTQRTYAHHLVDHLRWLASVQLDECTVTMADLMRYMKLCGSPGARGPLGTPWRATPLSEAAAAVRAAVVRGYYLDTLDRRSINAPLRQELDTTRLPTPSDRSRSFLGHAITNVATNPLAPTRTKRHPRLPPEHAARVLLEHPDALPTARDRLIVTWLHDTGMRVGELCGFHFSDLHLVAGHACGQCGDPHVHVIKRADNVNRARAKRGVPAVIDSDGVVCGGIIRRVSPAMIDTYWEYIADEYAQVRALTTTDLMLVHVAGQTAGHPLGTSGVRQMLERACRRAGLPRLRPHSFRHQWSTEMSRNTGGNQHAVAQEGGWASQDTLNEVYTHTAGGDALKAALISHWSAIEEAARR